MPANGRWDLIRRLKVKPSRHIFEKYSNIKFHENSARLVSVRSKVQLFSGPGSYKRTSKPGVIPQRNAPIYILYLNSIFSRLHDRSVSPAQSQQGFGDHRLDNHGFKVSSRNSPAAGTICCFASALRADGPHPQHAI